MYGACLEPQMDRTAPLSREARLGYASSSHMAKRLFRMLLVAVAAPILMMKPANCSIAFAVLLLVDQDKAGLQDFQGPI